MGEARNIPLVFYRFVILTLSDRFGSETPIDPAEDFTRLTFDTIALCSMSHRYAALMHLVFAFR